jgi:hypothetical protein
VLVCASTLKCDADKCAAKHEAIAPDYQIGGGTINVFVQDEFKVPVAHR